MNNEANKIAIGLSFFCKDDFAKDQKEISVDLQCKLSAGIYVVNLMNNGKLTPEKLVIK